ncbi:plasmolipin-like [Neodiprion fabricii]|uniref:plasmolipin-like n=1 Tax=Neodiprion fabricii TaxID=2872261 RepID=UPI001ED8CC13|nr:plasmolipin-like [Neodiprion fabricii]XP_046419037.1 plasmolipin-like [Neodiprion fabricii]
MQQGFPGQHTTTTMVTVGTTTVNPTIRFDRSLILTLPSILRITQMLFSLLGFICVTTTLFAYKSQGQWFNTVAMGGFWYTAIIFIFYLFHVIEKLHKIPWLKIELVFCIIWCVCNFVAAVVIVTYVSYDGALGFATFFGFGAMIAFGIDAYLKYMRIKRGEIAQGERQASKTVSSVTSPAY